MITSQSIQLYVENVHLAFWKNFGISMQIDKWFITLPQWQCNNNIDKWHQIFKVTQVIFPKQIYNILQKTVTQIYLLESNPLNITWNVDEPRRKIWKIVQNTHFGKFSVLVTVLSPGTRMAQSNLVSDNLRVALIATAAHFVQIHPVN